MRNILLKSIVVSTALVQTAVRSPVRIGDLARELSPQDVADIERALSPPGEQPWLLNGPRGQVSILRAVEAYLPPATANLELRRGSLVTLVNGTREALALDWPILAVVRQGDSIAVRLRKADFESQNVRLQPKHPGWLILAITMTFVSP